METLDRNSLDQLLKALVKRGYTPVGPTVRDHAIVYDEIDSSKDLPAGYADEQNAGTYRLKKRDDEALFGYTAAPQSWKRFLFPPAVRLWSARRNKSGFEPDYTHDAPAKYALVGVRPCELAAIAIQDRVFLEGIDADPAYAAARRNVFTVVVNCGQAGGTCFCSSMGTGPKASTGFDLALTEVIENGRHYFGVDAATPRGAEVAKQAGCRKATEQESAAAEEVCRRAAAQMGRSLDTRGIKDVLYRNYENSRWSRVAERCLSCGNCTLVCPTCFCTNIEDTTDLTTARAERWRRWDSCFNLDFSYIHGGSIRKSPASRYRQWLTHKLAAWIDQFGVSGCVGCGRCITWCPVGIDITEEVQAIRTSDKGAPAQGDPAPKAKREAS